MFGSPSIFRSITSCSYAEMDAMGCFPIEASMKVSSQRSCFIVIAERTAFSTKRPMSENTIIAALRRMGYARHEMTGHGFRDMAATLLNEMGLCHSE